MILWIWLSKHYALEFGPFTLLLRCHAVSQTDYVSSPSRVFVRPWLRNAVKHNPTIQDGRHQLVGFNLAGGRQLT